MPGTPSAFDEFYAEHFPPLAVQLYAYLGELTMAQQLTQEAFCRALSRWGRITREDEPGAWVRRAAWRLAGNRRPRPVLHPGPGGPADATFLAALAGVHGRPRRVFVLHHVAALPLADIADQEGVRLAKVRTALTRAQQSFTLANARAGEATAAPFDAPVIAAGSATSPSDAVAGSPTSAAGPGLADGAAVVPADPWPDSTAGATPVGEGTVVGRAKPVRGRPPGTRPSPGRSAPAKSDVPGIADV